MKKFKSLPLLCALCVMPTALFSNSLTIDESTTTFTGYVINHTIQEKEALIGSDKVLVKIFQFQPLKNVSSLDGLLSSIDANDVEVLGAVKGAPLPYPNPISLSTTYDHGPLIYYYLNKAMDIELRFYDIRGNEIHRDFFSQNSEGGSSGENFVQLNFNTWGADLPSSAYFFLIMNNGKVLEKGKFVIMP